MALAEESAAVGPAFLAIRLIYNPLLDGQEGASSTVGIAANDDCMRICSKRQLQHRDTSQVNHCTVPPLVRDERR